MYWIEFKDKNHSPYSINRPEEFLTERSILRRAKQNISINETDIPVSQVYLDSLVQLGVQIHNTSKWLNGAVIVSSDTQMVASLNELSFIKSAPITFRSALKTAPTPTPVFKFFAPPEVSPIISDEQLNMLKLPALHSDSITGKGVLVGILDAGFSNADIIESVSHVWQNNKVLGVRDFVKDGEDPLRNHYHGTMVFSIIAADWPDELQGAAPGAEFLLIRTENANSEYLVEEYNWLAGIEYADSIGVDIINSSLGYSLFEDETQNHCYDELNGYTTPVSKAAIMAARKGILVNNSAGNAGSSAWHHIIAPGDADSILTVGAVDAFENITTFSSRGPSADGRIKPDVTAMGMNTAGQIDPGTTTRGNGTSYSSPLIAGLAACLLQSSPEASAQEIRTTIIRSSSQFSSPDNSYGYGIPNAEVANAIISENYPNNELTKIALYPNPFYNEVNLELVLPWLTEPRTGLITLTNLSGIVLNSVDHVFYPNYNNITIPETSGLGNGYYIVNIYLYSKIYSVQLIKINN
jgi:hypothetical protein